MRTCCYSALWWLMGLVWHGGMMAAMMYAIFVRPVPVAALVASLVYLSTNVAFARIFHTQEIKKQQQQEVVVDSTESTTSSGDGSSASVEDVAAATTTGTVSVPPNIAQRSNSNHKGRVRIPFYLSILYLMTHLSWGIPGAMVVALYFPCGQDNSWQPTQHYWRTNLTYLPLDVVEWMKHPVLDNDDSFVQLGTDVYLTGSYEGSSSPHSLYVAGGQRTIPQALGYDNVFDLTRVSNDTVCFVQVLGLGPNHWSYDPDIEIGCGNAQSGFLTAKVNQKSSRQDKRRHENVALFSLQGGMEDGLLWFRLVTEDFQVQRNNRHMAYYCDFSTILNSQLVDAPALKDLCPWDRFAVLSMNVTTLQVTSYSTRVTALPTKNQDSFNVDEAYDEEEDGYNQNEEVFENDEEGEEGDDEFAADANGDAENVIDDFFESNSNGADYPDEDEDTTDEVVVQQEKENDSLFCPQGNFVTVPRAMGAFALSSLPVVVASARAWIKFAIPSASISLFVGLGLVCMFIMAAFDPWDPMSGMSLWLAFGTPIWACVCTYQLVVNPRVSRAPLWWSLHTILTVLLLLLLLIEYRDAGQPVYYGPQIWAWLCEILFYDLPVLVIAILTESRYFFILAVIGFASTTSTIIWDLSHPPTAYIFLCANFCILAVLFVCIYRSRGSLHNRFVRWLSACARHTCAIEALEDDTLDNDEVNTTGLLTNEAAEEA